jgi:predicted NAD/FAD-binding protein
MSVKRLPFKRGSSFRVGQQVARIERMPDAAEMSNDGVSSRKFDYLHPSASPFA